MNLKLSLVTTLLAGAVSHASAVEPQVRDTQRTDWPQRTDMTFVAGDQRFPVYQDPLYPSDFLVYDGHYCWLVSMESQTVSSLGCGLFQKSGERLMLIEQKADAAGVYVDGTKRLAGAEWLDAVWDCSSLSSLLFRRPDFEDKAVRFWACDKPGWATLTLSPS